VVRILNLLQLAVASAVGNAARIEIGLGGTPISPGLHLMLGVEALELLPPLQSMMQAALSPLLEFQAELVRRCQSASPHIREELAQAQATLSQLESAAFPDPHHIAHARHRVLALKHQLHALLVAQDVEPGQLVLAMHQSFDEYVLHVLVDQNRLDRLMNASKSARADLALMRAAWYEQPHFPPPGTNGAAAMPLSAPCLSSLIVCDQNRMHRFVRLGRSEPAAIFKSFWPIGLTTETSAVLRDLAGTAMPSDWDTTIRRLALMRSGPGQVYTLSPSAHEFLRESLGASAELCADEWDKINAGRHLLRLTLALHVLQAPGEHLVPPETLSEALQHYRWLMVAKQQAVREADNHRLEVTPATKEKMLQKIGAKQPVSWHDLRRSYKCDVRPYVRAVFNSLLEESMVTRDERDRIILRPKPGTREVPGVPCEFDGKKYFGIFA
jgi:hypothetical protein